MWGVGTIHVFCFRLLQHRVPRYETYDVLDDNQLTAFLSRVGRVSASAGTKRVSARHSVSVPLPPKWSCQRDRAPERSPMLVRDAASDAHNELAVETGWHDDDDYGRRIDALLAATAVENLRLARRERWEAGYATRDAAS